MVNVQSPTNLCWDAQQTWRALAVQPHIYNTNMQIDAHLMETHDATYGHALMLLLAPLVMALLLNPTIQIYAWLPEGHRNNIIEQRFGNLQN